MLVLDGFNTLAMVLFSIDCQPHYNVQYIVVSKLFLEFGRVYQTRHAGLIGIKSVIFFYLLGM